MKNSMVIVILLITGCTRVYNIPKDDYKLIPYKGNEKLIFKSNRGGIDTVFLQGIERFFSPIDQWSFPIKNCEHYRIISKRSDPTIIKGKGRYLDSLSLVTLVNDGRTKIEIEFTAKHAWFYGNGIYKKEEFLRLKDTAINVCGLRYSDVLILIPSWKISENKNGISKERSDYIVKLYWSKKYGVVRYDLIGGVEYWELNGVIKQ